MGRITATTRIAMGLACVTITVLLVAQWAGLLPDRRRDIVHGRLALCEMLAVHSSILAARGEVGRLESSLNAIVKRNPDIQSAALRRENGRLLVAVGDHASHWQLDEKARSLDSQMLVPITVAGRSWGRAEITFTPIERPGFVGWLQSKPIRLTAFMFCASYIAYLFYLRRVLRHLDPSKVVPDRVRSALDTLAEGLLVLDNDGRIVLANQSFAKSVGKSSGDLLGSLASDLPWRADESADPKAIYPWRAVMRDGQMRIDDRLALRQEQDPRVFNVNSSPIMGSKGECRGVLTSFNDVTQLEASRTELRHMLEALRQSRDEISRQNCDLQVLATQDPLTSCLNRRSFFGSFESQWKEAQHAELPLTCIMVDVDFFKSINDNHGHAMGDTVLKRVAEALRGDRRATDLVGRYGGEEFCLVLPGCDLDAGCAEAERCRQAIAALEFEEVAISVTASFGVSCNSLKARDPQQLLDQADECLYAAKRSGRNRVVRADDIPAHLEDDAAAPKRAPLPPEIEPAPSIPFPAVTALFSALAYRDGATADHSRRVADNCVAAALGLMPPSDVHVLEIAALLHDIGKIGVPDAILLKPGPLTDEEWKIMGIHDRIGVEILGAAFACDKLTKTVKTHHAWFGGNPRDPGLPTGEAIPLGARILTIADAYDAMVSDRVYRQGRSQEAAFAELRRCAGQQFDPQLVERFIDGILARDENRQPVVQAVSRQTALQISVEIERLARALDEQDLSSMSSLAGRLKQTAAKSGIPSMAELAGQIEELAAEEPDLLDLVKLTTDLLDLCRSTQRAFLTGDDGSKSTESEISGSIPHDALELPRADRQANDVAQ